MSGSPMNEPQNDQSVRQYRRHACDVPARVAIDDAWCAAVKLSAGSGVEGGWLGARIVDVSQGGLSLKANVYLPPGVLVKVCAARAGGGAPVETLVRVQRVRMGDRTPTYLIGASFAAGHPDEVIAGLIGQTGATSGGDARA